MESEFVERALRRAAPPVAILCCAALMAAVFLDYVTVHKFGNDFGVYWRTANQPVEQAYLWQGRFPFPYAPTMLLWIQPLALIPKWPAYFMFIAISLTALVLAVRPYLPKMALALCLLSPPFARGAFTGQVSAVLAALMLWACGTPNRLAAGMVFGLIASIKPQLVVMAPLMFVLNRDWRAFNAAAATLCATVFLSVVLFGPERWPEWLASMGHFHDAVVNTGVVEVGITPAVAAARFGLPPMPFMLFGTLAGAVTVYLCRNMPTLEKTAAIALGSLMAAPYALAYDLITVAPFLALSITRGRVGSTLALTAAFHPLPLVITAYELLRKVRLPSWRLRDA